MGGIAPFVGFKGGVVWHEGTRNRLFFDDIDLGRFHLYQKDWLVSAGAQIGLDWSINCNLGVVFTAEAVVTQGLRPRRNIPIGLDPIFTGGVTNFGIARTGKLVTYPITLGVRYTF